MKNIVLGIIGRNISYSFSQKYFTHKFKALSLGKYSYQVFDIQEIDEVEHVFRTGNLRGFNVTIPYKEKIIPYLDHLSPEAKAIGAVNTVLIKENKKWGFNTDAYGFEKTLMLHKKNFQTTAIVLGNGGAAKAIKFVLEQHQIPYETISRNSENNFLNLSAEKVKEHKIIIQCTPVGTFPNVHDCVDFPFEGITEQHLIIDLIYNPEQTEFMRKAKKNGAECVNGYYMLEQQAEKAWEIWKF